MSLSSDRKAQTRPTRAPAAVARAPKGGGLAEMGNALESLRIASTLLVVLYHAALSYVATPLRLTLWVAYDASGHVAFDCFIYWVNGFVMPVFFLAAGTSAPAACESRGPRVFLTHRALRLLRPLLFGCLTVLPVFYLLWGYGLMATSRCDLDSIMRWRFSPEVRSNLYGVGHLWFLEYLFLVCVLWCGSWTLRAALSRRKQADGEAPTLASRIVTSPWRPLLCAIPTLLLFGYDPDTMLRVDNTVVPNLSRLLHYAVFFTVGGWISKVREPKRLLAPFGTTYLVLSLVVFALMSPLLIRHAAAPLTGWPLAAFCILASLFPWLTLFGGLGVFLEATRTRGTAARYLTEASFWIYIVHVPVVAFMQLALLKLALPGLLKFLIVAAVAMTVSLVSYEFVVRRSLIGEIINGARKRSPKRGLLGAELGWVATLAAALLILAGAAWSSRIFFWGNNAYEVIPGRLYRSARLKPNDLESMIRREKLRSVVTFTGGGERHPWFLEQQRICRSHGTELHAINLSATHVPPRQTLRQLVETLDRSPRPLLVQGYRGIDHSGFAAAVAQLLGGSSPDVALRQFDLKYGQFGGPEHSQLGLSLIQYHGWLAAQGRSHTPDTFRHWANNEYLVNSFPPRPGVPVTRIDAIARARSGSAVAR